MRSVQFVRERTAEPILKEGFQDSPYPDRTEDGPDVGFLGSPDVWGPEIKGRNILPVFEIPEDALSGHEVVVMEDEPEIQKLLLPALLVNFYVPPVVEEADIYWPRLLDDIDTPDTGDDPK